MSDGSPLRAGVRAAVLLALCAGCSSGALVISTDDAAAGLDAAARDDDAALVRVTWPDRIACGRAASATLVLRNTGASTWSRATQHALAPVGDDALAPSGTRALLRDGDTVPPGATHAFEVPLVAPTTAGVFVTRWQMAHGALRFGDVVAQSLSVECSPTADVPAVTDAALDAPTSDTPTALDVPAAPDVPVAPDVPAPRDVPAVTRIDLASATVLNSPSDVASWPATARITRLDLGMDGVRIDFTRRDGADSWPDVPFITPGEDLQYTLWIVINVDGRWYTSGCIQYWRGLDRNGGPPSGYAMNWYYDPNRWRPMTGHQPAVGESVGFFVTAGNERNVTDGTCCVVRERSDVVVVPFPADPGAVFTF